MSKLKDQLKRIEKQQKKYKELLMEQQSVCPHVSKKGKSWVVPFKEGDVEKGKCKKCKATIILDKDLLANKTFGMSVEVIRTALSELRARNRTKQIKMDDTTMKLIQDFDSKVLTELPEFMEAITAGGTKPEKKKKKKKNKHHDNKRTRWS